MRTDISKLGIGLAVAFVLPAVGFLLGMIWDKAIGGWRNPTVRKSWTTFCLMMPIVFLGMIVKLGFGSLKALWLNSPLLFSIVYFIFGGLIPAGLIAAIIRIWQCHKSGEPTRTPLSS